MYSHSSRMHLDTICIKVEDTAESKVLSPTNTEEEGYGSGDEMHSGNESHGSGKSGELKRPDLKGNLWIPSLQQPASCESIYFALQIFISSSV
ncbi:unnamed protein product [Caenorhabditis nigoni]